MTSDQLPMRPIAEAEWPAYWRNILHTFHDDWNDQVSEFERSTFEYDRSLAIFDGDAAVATTGIFSRELTVPGAVLPAAHVTMVSVAQAYRRQGLLNRMMRRQLSDIAAGPEPIAVLWASEEAIYGRYGYGAASYQMAVEADTREVRLPAGDAPGRLRQVAPKDVAEDLSRVYEEVRAVQPGISSRQDPWWTYRLTDLEQWRKGATERRCVVYEVDGTITGYALWRGKKSWDHAGPNGEIQVEELMSGDLAGRMALWRFLFDIDLSRKVSGWNVPVDEPLFQLIDAPRRLTPRYGSALFVRVVDLPAALAARRYAAPVELVFEVADPLLPDNAGRWRLQGGPEKATCERTDAPADLALDVRELGAAYLGGTGIGSLARAGLVTEHRAGAVAEAHAAFGWPVAPYAPEVF
ncbi:MAG: GNAT family N-acetyltransferase [Micromonosporaceae bacterium]